MSRSGFLACAFLALAASGAPASEGGASSATLVSVAIEGSESADLDDLREALGPWKEDAPWSEEGSERAHAALRTFYRNRGFLEVAVSTRAEVFASSSSWAAAVTEGPRFRFGVTRVSGLDRVRERVVRLERAYGEGEFFSPQKLFDTQRRLYDSRLFEDVSIRTSTTAARTVEVAIEVRERRAKWIKTGVGYGSDERQRANLTLTHRNLLGRGYLAETAADLSAIWLEFRGEFVNRRLFATETEARLRGSWRREDRAGYDIEQSQGRVSLSRDLGFDLQAAAHYRVSRTVAFHVDPDILETTPDETVSGTVGLGLERDTADDIFFPSRGTRSALLLERTGGFFGGNVHFLRAALDGSLYHRLWRSLLAAGRVRAGALKPTGRTVEIPVYERFFTGGASSVRGYRERHIGPFNALGSPLGGDIQLGASAELRLPLFWRFTAAAFVDGGQVGQRLNFVEPSRWKWGSGLGLRVRTPVGPFRADFGYKLNPDPGDADLWRLHLSLGEAF